MRLVVVILKEFITRFLSNRSHSNQVMKHPSETGENDALEAQHKTDFLNLLGKDIEENCQNLVISHLHSNRKWTRSSVTTKSTSMESSSKSTVLNQTHCKAYEYSYLRASNLESPQTPRRFLVVCHTELYCSEYRYRCVQCV